MRSFTCDNCGQLIFFGNLECLNCGHALGYDRNRQALILLEGSTMERCDNVKLARCNWLTPPDTSLCGSCELTRTRPEDGDGAGLAAFIKTEAAKRHLLYELDRLRLPVEGSRERRGGLAFDLLSSASERVTTGHADGVITLDLAESDDVHRRRMQEQLGEPYRTILGHLRHEVGHYYFPLLVADDAREAARALFGDERSDYGGALERHYEQGPPPDWHRRHVSAYATMHPSEDWAESFAHYLHIRDTLQTGAAYRMSILGAPSREPLGAWPRENYPDEFTEIIDDWLPLTYALNALNRSMGQDPLYPFVLSSAAIEKLGFVHSRVKALA